MRKDERVIVCVSFFLRSLFVFNKNIAVVNLDALVPRQMHVLPRQSIEWVSFTARESDLNVHLAACVQFFVLESALP